jgi:hypothetical protein
MKRISIIGLVLVAGFATSAFSAVSSASAVECPTGTSKPCIVNNANEAVKGKITTTDNEISTLETKAGTQVKCAANTSEGEASGVKKVKKVTVKFTGCQTTVIGTCNSPGEPAEHITTKALEGEIGYITEGKSEVGLDLWAEGRTESELKEHKFHKLLAEFSCVKLANNKVEGSVIGLLTPNNTKGRAFKLSYKAGANKGEQEIQKLPAVEGGVKDVLFSSLNNGPFEESNEQAPKVEVTMPEEAELRA